MILPSALGQTMESNGLDMSHYENLVLDGNII